jgi:hypothetical protein
MALAEKRICEHTDATTISSADEFIVDSMANGTRNITMTNLENQILSTDTYSALTGIGDGTITGSIADIDSNLNNLTYDSTTNRLTMTGNTAFSGTIDSVPTAGSGNAVSSGGTKTYVDSAVSQLNDDLVLESFTPTLASALGTPTFYDHNCFYNPKTKQVHLQVLIYSPDGLIPTAGQTIFTVATKYRPAVSLQLGMVFLMSTAQFDSRTTRMERCYIGSNGVFALNNFIYGGQATKVLYFVGDYIAK